MQTQQLREAFPNQIAIFIHKGDNELQLHQATDENLPPFKAKRTFVKIGSFYNRVLSKMSRTRGSVSL